MTTEKMIITAITLHCTATPNGRPLSRSLLKRMHVQERGWRDIGYHYVLNTSPDEKYHGSLYKGRNDETIGAHVHGHNVYMGGINIGIALVGTDKFTIWQWMGFWSLQRTIREKWGLPIERIFNHHYFNPHKECPCVPLPAIRLWAETVDRFKIAPYILPNDFKYIKNQK